MTDVALNRWGEPMIRLKGMTINDYLKAGEEVRFKYTLNKLVIRAKSIYY
jgi:hypothetical protein